ncbi:MAG: sensor histidine kinase [Balneolaceae bacterium]|nr:sensor histidine kinase [Balneolaceae bacterium]MBO6545483.1 sensor histidine kinase [Balneolaceae bacterium]MBO6646879.1 sensor histidine kinase [Balneolaceae bacterium]
MKRIFSRVSTAVLLCLISSNLAVSQNILEAQADSVYAFIESNYRTNWDAIPDSARKLLKISREMEDRQKEADANKFLGVYYFRTSNQDSSIYHYQQAANINEELGNTLEQAKNTLNIGMSYQNLGEFEKTIEFSLEAARYFEEVEDFKGMAIVYNMVGSVYYYQSRYTEAVEFMQKYLEHAEKADDIFEIASANQNLGAVLTAAERELEAIPYLAKASQLHKETGNDLGVATNSINVGTIYFNNGEFKQAIPYFEEGYKGGKSSGNARVLLEAISNLSGAYLNIGEDRKALEFAEEGIEVATNSGDQYMQMLIYQNKANALYNLGDFEEAFTALGVYQEVKDSVINQENLERIAELETQYETEQKERQIAELETERAQQELTIQQNRMLQSGLGGVVILLIIVGFLWQSKVKERELTYKVEQLEVEKEIQAERARISRDLHDNVGAQLVNIISGIDLFERYKNTSKEKESEQVLNSLKEEAKTSIGQLRDTIWALKSDEQTSQTFVDHVNNYLNNVEKISELSVETSLNDLKDIYLSPTQSLNIFRIIQEATQNTLKHSGATTFQVSGSLEGTQVLLTIYDNGSFKTSNENGTGSGMGNMKKRAKDAGAEILVDTSGDGTRITLEFPATEKSKFSETV